ncbi:MAG: thiamine phosphate synthase [Pyrinomonadaceae bacterium]
MRFNLPKIYPITDTGLSSLSHTEQVRRLIAGGAKLIQLREKNNSVRAFYDDACEAIRIARLAGTKLIINDRVDVALALDADGVHLGQTDIPVAAARRLLGTDAIIGFSTHTIEQVRAALDLPINYLAFGPIFATESKTNPDPITGLEALRLIKSCCHLPVVAIGGINRSNVARAMSAGADSAAIISAIVNDPGQITENVHDFFTLANIQRS